MASGREGDHDQKGSSQLSDSGQQQHRNPVAQEVTNFFHQRPASKGASKERFDSIVHNPPFLHSSLDSEKLGKLSLSQSRKLPFGQIEQGRYRNFAGSPPPMIGGGSPDHNEEKV